MTETTITPTSGLHNRVPPCDGERSDASAIDRRPVRKETPKDVLGLEGNRVLFRLPQAAEFADWRRDIRNVRAHQSIPDALKGRAKDRALFAYIADVLREYDHAKRASVVVDTFAA
jgi:hypothetical protein